MLEFLGDILIPHPFVALAPAFLLLVLYYMSKSRFILTVSFLWMLYAVYEWLNLLRITCSGECNIRIDLFLIYPMLVLLTLSAMIYFVVKIQRRSGI